MNREEASREIDNTACCFSDKRFRDAMHMAAAALRGPQPDPITGLVPCGCGGKAMIHECHNLSHVIYCDKCKIETNYQLTADTAKDAWNTAMGYKEQ